MKFRKPALFVSALAIASGVAFAMPPIERIMERLDVDDDGLISRDEFQPPSRGRAKRIDTNEDGAISTSEMIAHQQKMTQRQQERHQQMLQEFESADADDDGLVTAEEARLAAFIRADKDGDGYLTSDELKNARPQGPGHGFKHQRGRPNRDKGNGQENETY